MYMNNLLWIKGAGYGNFVRVLNQPAGPLKANARADQFRVYLSDTGMLMNMMGEAAVRALWSGDSSYNLSDVAENAVAECLVKSGYAPYYYHKTSGGDSMEIDFIFELRSGIVAVEVKSGKHREAPSIGKLKNRTGIRCIMFENGNIREEDGIEHYPLFASAFAGCLEKE